MLQMWILTLKKSVVNAEEIPAQVYFAKFENLFGMQKENM